MKRVAADTHLWTPRLFTPAIRPYDRSDYHLDCSFRTYASTRYTSSQISGLGRTVRANSGQGSSR